MHPGRLPVREPRIRKLNILRMLMVAWSRNTTASVRNLIKETIVFCNQIGYEPQIQASEVSELIKELGLEELLVPQPPSKDGR